MPHIQIRFKAGIDSPEDIRAVVQDQTFDYLMSSLSPEIRVSAYLDQDWPNVQATYAEIVVAPDCHYESKIIEVIPGSKTRKAPKLPAAMQEGEQLVIKVVRRRLGNGAIKP